MILEKSFYFLRHGQTDHNAQNIVAGGKTDSPLNKYGQLQAKAVSNSLVAYSLNKVVCSPMQRAVHTAQLATGMPLIIEPDLREWEIGDFEGSTYDSFIKHIQFLPAHVPLPNGESKAAFYQRAVQAVNSALAKHGENILIVSHGGIGYALFDALGMEEEEVHNGQLLYFQYEKGVWRVVKL